MSESEERSREPSRATNGTVDAATLGYLICPQTADKGFAGALLVTDERTRPLHFAFVSPVRPTGMQRLLYGATLNGHIKIDVIGAKLLTSGLSIVPSVLFVDSDDLIEIRRLVKWPVASLTQGGQDPSSLSMLRYNTGSNEGDGPHVGRIVANLEQAVNLLDPFARLRDALKEALKGEAF